MKACTHHPSLTCEACAHRMFGRQQPAKDVMAQAEDDVERRIDAAYDEHRQARRRLREPKETP